MTNYTFKTLNDKEFEVLVRDLLSEELQIEFQNFKSGKDKGIDLRYSTSMNNKIVVQVKHYANSKFAQLKYTLENTELPKVKQLNPERYIVVTSLELNPSEVEEIKNIFSPYVQSLSDVYWNQSLNSLLSKFKNIERNHFKLWFSSTSIINNILHNSSFLKSHYLKAELENKVSHYVKTEFHDKATEILKTEKVLLITGAPGVGKTTLAQMIAMDFINDGYEHLVIEDKISDAENLLALDENKRQIIYFDDFLGANIYEILNPRNSEHSLIRFISRIRSSPNKYLILTTRTTILNQALSTFEKLKYKKLHEDSVYEIFLNEYSRFQKAEILYNHFYFGNLKEDFLKCVFQDKNYIKIIEHDNYNPRLIEFFTNEVHLKGVTSDNYVNFIIHNLNNPSEIWRNSYENQIDDECRFLLNSLFTLRGEASLVKLEMAFCERIKSEVENYGYRVKNNAFNISIKKLESSYLKSSSDGNKNNVLISFVNPSIFDFLLNYMKDSNSEKLRLIQGMAYIEQVINVFHPDHNWCLSFNRLEGIKYYKSLIKNESNFRELIDRDSFDLEFLKMLLSLFYGYVKEEDIIRLFNKIDLDDFYSLNVDDLIYVIGKVSYIDEVKEVIISKWNYIILELYKNAELLTSYYSIEGLFDDYSLSYEDFLSETENYDVVYEVLISFLSERIEQSIIDKVGEYHYEESIEYTQVGWQEYIEKTEGYALIDDIDEIIQDELRNYRDMRFMSSNPFITNSDLDIYTLDLVSRLENEFLEGQLFLAELDGEYESSGDSSYLSDFESENDRIDDLFSDLEM